MSSETTYEKLTSPAKSVAGVKRILPFGKTVAVPLERVQHNLNATQIQVAIQVAIVSRTFISTAVFLIVEALSSCAIGELFTTILTKASFETLPELSRTV